MLNRNVDFRYPEGFPSWQKALVDGTRVVRCISLPEMEAGASDYLRYGIRVIAVYTGESDNAGHYVMQNCSALQIGNEPQFAYPEGKASWPTGSADDMVNVWGYVANDLVGNRALPLIGPGFWAQDYAKWAQIAPYLPKLSAAAVHCYPDESANMSLTMMRDKLSRYRGVRADLPLICTEWATRRSVLSFARSIDTYCDDKLWYGPGDPYFTLEGTAEYGILALAR
jgi:hypothetical protein